MQPREAAPEGSPARASPPPRSAEREQAAERAPHAQRTRVPRRGARARADRRARASCSAHARRGARAPPRSSRGSRGRSSGRSSACPLMRKVGVPSMLQAASPRPRLRPPGRAPAPTSSVSLKRSRVEADRRRARHRGPRGRAPSGASKRRSCIGQNFPCRCAAVAACAASSACEWIAVSGQVLEADPQARARLLLEDLDQLAAERAEGALEVAEDHQLHRASARVPGRAPREVDPARARAVRSARAGARRSRRPVVPAGEAAQDGADREAGARGDAARAPRQAGWAHSESVPDVRTGAALLGGEAQRAAAARPGVDHGSGGHLGQAAASSARASADRRVLLVAGSTRPGPVDRAAGERARRQPTAEGCASSWDRRRSCWSRQWTWADEG